MINDTMLRHSPETGYPVTKVRRRRRVQASPDGGLPHDPMHRRLTRWGLQGLAGIFFLLAAAWLVFGVSGHVRAWTAGDQADRAVAALDQQWAEQATASAPSADPAAGAVWGKLHVPSLGLDAAPIYEGTDAEQIDVGVGHYTSTEFPWQPGGNMGLAGHRTGWGELFNRLDELGPGDKVYVETSGATHEYTVTGSEAVAPADVWVLDDTPGPSTGATGPAQLLTLTTCDGPDNEARLVVWGQLTAIHDKTSSSIRG